MTSKWKSTSSGAAGAVFMSGSSGEFRGSHGEREVAGRALAERGVARPGHASLVDLELGVDTPAGEHDERRRVARQLDIGRGEVVDDSGPAVDHDVEVALEWALEVVSLGAGEILLTSMDGDGTKAGYDLELTRMISDAVDVPVIASGGVGTLEHLVDGATEGHADAVLAASIFHFGEHTVAEAKEALLAAGVAVRPPGS